MARLKVHHWILISMVCGALIGLPLNILAAKGVIPVEVARGVAKVGKSGGSLFLRFLQMIVIPLIFSSLVCGITSMGNLKQLSRLGGRTLGWYLMTSALAIAVGILMVNLFHPGAGANLAELKTMAKNAHVSAPTGKGGASVAGILWNQVQNMIPKNPLKAAADGKMLPTIFFALFLGTFINLTGGEHGERLTKFFDAVFAVMMKMTMFVIRLAPIGVFGFMLYASAGHGVKAFVALARYMLTVATGLLVHGLLVLPALLFLLTKRSPVRFAKDMGPALLTAFSTASSNATLPLTMTSIEERAGVPNRVSSFVLPLGATINMDGTALYECVAVLFIAQATGHDLTLGQQVLVAFTALTASVGAAGIPHAGTVMMVVVLSAVNLPPASVGLVLAVDRILDMGRTTINVWSDSIAAAVVSSWDEDLPPASSEDAPSAGS